MPSSLRLTRILVAICAGLLLVSCAAPTAPEPSPTASASASEANLGVLGAEGCSPPSPTLGQEIQGTGSEGVTAYGLMFVSDAGAMVADGSSTKMVVRMTGDGELAVHLIAPDGVQRPLEWGPELHGGSTFHRPGSEWGIGFAFDAPGCWQIAFEREGGDRADFWFDVAA